MTRRSVELTEPGRSNAETGQTSRRTERPPRIQENSPKDATKDLQSPAAALEADPAGAGTRSQLDLGEIITPTLSRASYGPAAWASGRRSHTLLVTPAHTAPSPRPPSQARQCSCLPPSTPQLPRPPSWATCSSSARVACLAVPCPSLWAWWLRSATICQCLAPTTALCRGRSPSGWTMAPLPHPEPNAQQLFYKVYLIIISR